MQKVPVPPTYEVVILTALGLEYQAVSEHLQDLQEITHQGTVYGCGTFTGQHRTWHVAVAEIGMGGPTAATETERAISYFQPHITLFVGVGGGLKDVKLGDVVAASKIYAYESGRVGQQFQPRPEVWRASHALVQRARAEARSDQWLTLLGSSCPDPAPRVHIGALAAGEKVLASTQSDLFRLLKTTYGDALAVEMEGHGFLAAVHVNHSVHALVIRGISDLIDGKAASDAAGSQAVAARHAAAFAFQALANFSLPCNGRAARSWPNQDEAFVEIDRGIGGLTQGVAPIMKPPSPSGRFGTPFPEVWNVFRRHNPFFTGRDQVVEQLFAGFRLDEKAGIVPAQAITGLGGMGKTQTAAEYAYRFREHYQAVLWVRAETRAELVLDFQTIAGMLHYPRELLRDEASLLQTMHEWFRNQAGWLLIFDNADDLALVHPFVPRAARGHILLTTCAGATIEQAQPFVLGPLNPDDGALCILRRAGLLAWDKPLNDASRERIDAARQLSRLMDGLPLALEQAGAYIEDTGCGVPRYLKLYQQYRQEIQQLHHGAVPDYPASVASAWRISMSSVERSNPAAADLLRLCAFFAPEAIPDELLSRGASALGPVLGPTVARPVALDQTIGLLRRYSLLHREADRGTELTRLSIHQVLQEILLDEMDAPTRQLWGKRAVCALTQALPSMPWSLFQAHVRNCLRLVERWHMLVPEAEQLKRLVEEAERREEP